MMQVFSKYTRFATALTLATGTGLASSCGSAAEGAHESSAGTANETTNDDKASAAGESGFGGHGANGSNDGGAGGETGGCTAPDCECVPDTTEACEEHPGLDGKGPCRSGERRCVREGSTTVWGPCRGSVGPALADRCDVAGDDSNCDGRPNQGCDCIGGERSTCGDAHGALGECAEIEVACLPSGKWPGAPSCAAASVEICANGKDDDCDGRVDDGCTCTDGDQRPCGECNAGTQLCADDAWGPCSDVLSATSERGPNMLCVPAGTFNMGSADPNLLDHTRPVHPVTLPSFWMDETEVTTAQYVACIDDEGCFEPIIGYGCNYLAGAVFDDHPINCVNWKDADAFCRWAGKRLPLEEEWEYAARGTDGRIYAWGNEPPNDEIVHWSNTGDIYAKPVASYPSGRSPFGLYDMTGNVREWTGGDYCPYPESGLIQPCDALYHVLRGGDFANGGGDPIWLHAAMRQFEHFSSFAWFTGFRCAKDVAR